MFHLFSSKKTQKDDNSKIQEPTTKCFVGVAAAEYGKLFDIIGLYCGKFDNVLQTNNLLFHTMCTVFSNKEIAIKETSRKGVTDNSAYVLELDSTPSELEKNIKSGNKKFSQLICSITNAMTDIELDFNALQVQQHSFEKTTADGALLKAH